MNVQELLMKLYKENDLTLEELTFIIKNIKEDDQQLLFNLALKTKKVHFGDSVYMRGLIEFSNYCKQNCSYCGIRRENEKADRYRLSKEQILDCCHEGYRLGYRTFVMQGGEDAYFNDHRLTDIIKSIKEIYPDVAITLSVGERSEESYKKLHDAGVDRYLLRHETASKEIYESIHPGMRFENRRDCLNTLKKLGFQVGAGYMVGLPNQGPKELAMDLKYIKELQPHMVGIGPFIPNEDTPLGSYTGGTLNQTIIMVALTRLMLPNVLLPSTTALGTLDSFGREQALNAGANVVMPNLSPTDFREKYALYKNKICTGDEAAHCRGCIEGKINKIGFKVDMSRGDHSQFSTK